MDAFIRPTSSGILENEKEIVEKAKTNDQAFEILYNFYFPKIYGYVFKRIGDRAQTEDIVSQTFMKVFTNIGGYSYQGFTFGSWVYKIATNNLVDHYRKQGKGKQVDLDSIKEVADTQNRGDENANQSLNKQIVAKIIIKMPEKYQTIIHLKFFAEKDTDEIAQILKISANNSRVLLHRALKKFHKIYAETIK